MLPAGARASFRVLADVLTVAFFLVVGWSGYAVLEVLGGDNLVSLPQVSVAWVQSVVPVSAVLIIVAELLTMPGAVARARAGRGAAQTGEASH
jgi:TRAP-type C4-dicarboxylate transport system permease small subunit